MPLNFWMRMANECCVLCRITFAHRQYSFWSLKYVYKYKHERRERKADIVTIGPVESSYQLHFLWREIVASLDASISEKIDSGCTFSKDGLWRAISNWVNSQPYFGKYFCQGFPLLNGINSRITALIESGLIKLWTVQIINENNNYAKVISFLFQYSSRITNYFLCYSLNCEIVHSISRWIGSIWKAPLGF